MQHNLKYYFKFTYMLFTYPITGSAFQVGVVVPIPIRKKNMFITVFFKVNCCH